LKRFFQIEWKRAKAPHPVKEILQFLNKSQSSSLPFKWREGKQASKPSDMFKGENSDNAMKEKFNNRMDIKRCKSTHIQNALQSYSSDLLLLLPAVTKLNNFSFFFPFLWHKLDQPARPASQTEIAGRKEINLIKFN